MFYCCDTMPGLHFFNGGDIVSRGGFIHQRRTMECWVLIYVLSGRLDIFTDGREYSAVAAEWLLLRPGAARGSPPGSYPTCGGISAPRRNSPAAKTRRTES